MSGFLQKMADLQNTVIEEREQLMVSPFQDSKPALMKAHFLKPSATFRKNSTFHLPTPSPSWVSSKEPPFKASYSGWSSAGNWKLWLQKMLPMHKHTWESAGIYEAIMNTTSTIRKDENLLLALVGRWNFETNTFVFPWGEATITLEDVYVLGGYSILGDCVLRPATTEEMIQAEAKLNEVRMKLIRSTQRAPVSKWLSEFFKNESEVEHEAFLCYWLSRFVFPSGRDLIRKHVFPIAACLARGIRIALAPAFLAGIYRDLRLLKERILESNKVGCTKRKGKNASSAVIWAPIQLVQVWAWERFVGIRPEPNLISQGEPRSARWDTCRKPEIPENVGLSLDDSGLKFQWRPYSSSENGNIVFHNFYGEKEEGILDNDHNSDSELQSFARCLRACKLIGFNCIEHYHPFRVSMQFGFDQDIPGWVIWLNESPEVSWRTYSDPINVGNLYIPHRLAISNVSLRYLEWYKQLRSLCQEVSSNDDTQTALYRSKHKRVAKFIVEEDEETMASVIGSKGLKCTRKKKIKGIRAELRSHSSYEQSSGEGNGDEAPIDSSSGKLHALNTDDSTEKDKQDMVNLSKRLDFVVGYTDDSSKASSNSQFQIEKLSPSKNEVTENFEQLKHPRRPLELDKSSTAKFSLAVDVNESLTQGSMEKNETKTVSFEITKDLVSGLDENIRELEANVAKVKQLFIARGLMQNL